MDIPTSQLHRELSKQIAELYLGISTRLDSGSLENFGEYKFLAGQLVAYTRILNIMKEVTKGNDGAPLKQEMDAMKGKNK